MPALDYFRARAAAGRVALAITNEHPPRLAAEIIRGALHGPLLCSAKFDGWDATLKAIHEIASASRVPAEKAKPKLVICNGG